MKQWGQAASLNRICYRSASRQMPAAPTGPTCFPKVQPGSVGRWVDCAQRLVQGGRVWAAGACEVRGEAHLIALTLKQGTARAGQATHASHMNKMLCFNRGDSQQSW